MKVLISGASGGFGSELIKYLNNFDTISLRYGEINEEQKSKLSNCDVFIHCGALLKGSFNDLFDSNVLLTKNILDYLILENPNVNFVYLSSMSLLQKKQNILHNDFLDFRNMTDYALSKYISEILCSRYRIPITIVRFSTLFYKNPTRDVLSKLIYDAVKNNKIVIYNNGVAKRDFLPLDIAAQYVEKLIGKEKFLGKILNIVSGRETSFKEIANFLKIRIPDLIIENKDLELTDTVPTKFSCDDIYSLGEIKFNIFEKIDEYIHESTKKITFRTEEIV